jgi:hypothetical protein
VIRDPAERQVAVECLMVISRIADRNPEMHVNTGPLDLLKIIKDAVSQFWLKWVHEQSPGNLATATAVSNGSEYQIHPPLPGRRSPFPTDLGNPPVQNITPSGSTSSLAQYTDVSYERNERLARRLFFDLPQDGNNATMSYLAKSCVRICFDVNWAGDTDEVVASAQEDDEVDSRGRRRERDQLTVTV